MRWPVACRSGTSATSGARTPSEIRSAARGPMRCSTEPAGMPRSATGASSTAKTTLIRLGDPVVTSTNHGSARFVSWEPSLETNSPITSARIERSRITRSRARRRLHADRPDARLSDDDREADELDHPRAEQRRLDADDRCDRAGEGSAERHEDERAERVVRADARAGRLRHVPLEHREPEREVDRDPDAGDDGDRDERRYRQLQADADRLQCDRQSGDTRGQQRPARREPQCDDATGDRADPERAHESAHVPRPSSPSSRRAGRARRADVEAQLPMPKKTIVVQIHVCRRNSFQPSRSSWKNGDGSTWSARRGSETPSSRSAATPKLAASTMSAPPGLPAATRTPPSAGRGHRGSSG